MTKRISLIIAAAALAFGFGFISQSPELFDLKFRNDFFAGFGGDKEALDRGMKACETELTRNPKTAGALVWHSGELLVGSGQYFVAGDQAKGMELWQQALQEKRSAVAIALERVGVRVPLQIARPLAEACSHTGERAKVDAHRGCMGCDTGK